MERAFLIPLLGSVLWLAGACVQQESSSSGATTAKEQAQELPTSKDDITDNNDTEERGVNTDFTPGATPEYPLHADAPLIQKSFPKLQAIDPRTFTPSGKFELASAEESFLFEGLLFPDDGRAWEYPACPYPIAAPGNEKVTTITVDGSFSDWPANSVVVVDQMGDGPNGQGSYDITAVRWASDETALYLGIETAESWSGKDAVDLRVTFEFGNLSLPTNDKSLPDYETAHSLDVIGAEVWTSSGSSYSRIYPATGSTGANLTLARSGKNIELRIARSELGRLNLNKPFAVHTYSYQQDAGRSDSVGSHIVGLQDDYACLVPVPDAQGTFTSAKMLVMRRHPQVDAGIAEVGYRTYIAAIASATHVTEDVVDQWDTANAAIIPHMSAAGVYIGELGMFMAEDPMHYSGETGLPSMYFEIAAHEYIHSYNSSDYQLPASWAREGHSEWFALRVLEAYHGRSVFQNHLQYNVWAYRDEEKLLQETAGLSDDDWLDSPFSALYYYRKAATFWALLLDRLDYSEVLNQVLRKPMTGKPFASSDKFLTGLAALPSYQGSKKDELGRGWVTHPTATPVVATEALADDDHDGFFLFQEEQAGTKADSPDSDEDGVSDTAEWVLGLDPLRDEGHAFLVADHYLGDWDKQASHLLFNSPLQQGDAANCPEESNIVRYGVATSGNRVLLAIELGETPVRDSELQVVVFVDEPGRSIQLISEYTHPYFVATGSNTARSQDMMAPFAGSQLELAMQGFWMDWDDEIPSGAGFRFATYYGDLPCDYTPVLTVQH